MKISNKVSGTLAALGYTYKELEEFLHVSTRRAKEIINGEAGEIEIIEYCRICDMLGVDANFFYFKGGKIA